MYKKKAEFWKRQKTEDNVAILKSIAYTKINYKK